MTTLWQILLWVCPKVGKCISPLMKSVSMLTSIEWRAMLGWAWPGAEVRSSSMREAWQMIGFSSLTRTKLLSSVRDINEVMNLWSLGKSTISRLHNPLNYVSKYISFLRKFICNNYCCVIARVFYWWRHCAGSHGMHQWSHYETWLTKHHNSQSHIKFSGMVVFSFI